MESKIYYKDWEFEVDKELTENTYLKNGKSGGEECGCTDCKNFIKQREKIFPLDIVQLFSVLGIDYRKETEISHIARLESGYHLYSGWFHFKGKFEGMDCTEILPSGGYKLNLQPLTENFGIGFRNDNSLTFFEDGSGLVQIEFECKIPWILNNEREPQ
jgi:hypothetical protein